MKKGLLISQAPMRLSFLGGGTDFESYFKATGKTGRVFGTSINKYVYVMATEQPSFEPHPFKFTYSKTETVSSPLEISHPVVRAVLNKQNWNEPINLATMASLPGRSGMGSSSAFTVALINVLASYKNTKLDPRILAEQAVDIERRVLGESGGVQDQYHSAVGGVRLYEFSNNQNVFTDEVGTREFRNLLSDSLFIIPIGTTRDSFEYAAKTEEKINQDVYQKVLDELSELTLSTVQEISNTKDPERALDILALGMREGWSKKLVISKPPDSSLEELIQYGTNSGASAGKLCGAGGSGFAAFIVKPGSQSKFLSKFNSEEIVKIALSNTGAALYEV